MNSSKIKNNLDSVKHLNLFFINSQQCYQALSSDSSQSDREQQLNSSNNLMTTQQITSPISSSSPTHFHHKNESNFNNTNPSIANTSALSNNNIVANNSILNRLSNIPSISTQNQSAISSPSLNQPNTVAKTLTSSTSSSTSSCSLSNQNGLPIISIPSQSSTSQTAKNISKPYKPYNSQNGQYNQRDTTIDSSSLSIQKLNINNDNTQHRASMSLNGPTTVIPQYGINNKSITATPVNSSN